MATLVVLAFAALVAFGALPAGAGAVTVPEGFEVRRLPIKRGFEADPEGHIKGLVKPTTIDFGPDGKMFVAEWVGRVKVFDSVDDTTPTLAVDIATDVHSFGDRGLLGMKLDPQFGTSGHNYIYLSYAYDVPMGSSALAHAEYSDGGDNCKNESPWTDCLISGRIVRIALDPTTGVAVGGAVAPPQQVLVQSWCQQFNSHSMGDLEFDSSGALLASGGEGANYAAADHGQFSNPCGDPPNEGGSLRAQDVLTPSVDQTDYSGSIIRMDPATGDALPTNPLYGSSDVRARRIVAYGMRNPFRMQFRPGTDELYVADVGQSAWEELDRLNSPPSSALDFGWPCYEGGSGVNSVMPDWKALADAGEAPPCATLYANPSLVTPSIWAYAHVKGAGTGLLFSGDKCSPNNGAVFSGLTFYEDAGVPSDTAFPSEYDGAMFMADAARGCVWTAPAGTNGKPDLSKVANFAYPASGEPSGLSVVDLVEGPDGALYGSDFYDSSIEQIRYFGSNSPPQAALSADKVDGPLSAGKFTVNFNAGGSSDAEGDPIHYAWDLDGDGQFDDGSDQPTAQRTYTSEDNVVVSVRVSDEFDRSDIASVTIYPGDEGPPVPTIDTVPPDGWAVGDTLQYAGHATDPDGGPIDYKWTISIQHCPLACHEHPYIEPEAASGSLVAPPHEYPSHLRFVLTATDSRGRSVPTEPRDSFPAVIDINLASDPAGIPVTFAGEPASAGPFHLIAGGSATVSAPPTATVNGVSYSFDSWSDGSTDASHEFTSKVDTDLVARYKATGSSGGGSSISPGPLSLLLPPKQTPTVKVTVVSRPPGVKIKAAGKSKRAPFSLEVKQGSTVALRAPGVFSHAGKRLKLRGWLVRGKLKKTAQVKAGGASGGRYVAIYGSR
ncbi:MAG: PQQ-dependent sugar dehydrogenase [Solirubrobacterales bacterium]